MLALYSFFEDSLSYWKSLRTYANLRRIMKTVIYVFSIRLYVARILLG
jgi:N-glycosylase/DNA lyase